MKEPNSIYYVVTRNGIRVSEKEYLSSEWDQATQERDFWLKVSERAKDGSKVEIVNYDTKKHQV